jgi:hypothetical protein
MLQPGSLVFVPTGRSEQNDCLVALDDPRKLAASEGGPKSNLDGREHHPIRAGLLGCTLTRLKPYENAAANTVQTSRSADKSKIYGCHGNFIDGTGSKPQNYRRQIETVRPRESFEGLVALPLSSFRKSWRN